ncbi:hypothetical protein DUNSADRAFT_1986 [Dunaliella salina]|uniref:Encoded protein n=1 Tax=Dunaliella salina TaxID=3046 RepID=A0ABQ7GWE5_DUNSA|nr:hypothetical protein DUNSADRAFT_1986 [Dunaliella salina]|eukprot:KAF5838895.1 hypothetical protein DUNSADRAFT_1986 [Dunaliella salina]
MQVTAALATAVTPTLKQLNLDATTLRCSLASRAVACKDSDILAQLRTKGGRSAQVPLEQRIQAGSERDVPVYHALCLTQGSSKPCAVPRAFHSELLSSVPAPAATPWQLVGHGHGYPLQGLDWLSLSACMGHPCVTAEEQQQHGGAGLATDVSQEGHRPAPGGARQRRGVWGRGSVSECAHFSYLSGEESAWERVFDDAFIRKDGMKKGNDQVRSCVLDSEGVGRAHVS